MNEIEGKRVIIWGCGRMGRRVFQPLCDLFDVKVVAYVDSSPEIRGGGFYNTPVMEPCEILRQEYDYVLIAVYKFESIREIEQKLNKLGIPSYKIKIMSNDPCFIEAFMDQRMYWIRDFSLWCYERNLQGNVAECGVFRGDSAKFINKYFYDKKLYLFDTFESFAEKDVEYEVGLNNQAYNNGPFRERELFFDTDLDLLKGKIQYPDNIKIYKGYFPETAEGIEDSFCFVNLDMDLYISMLNGIRFFWDKMVTDGCILLHDYFHPELPGVKAAVCDFERERNINIRKMPIGDRCSLAFIK